MTISYTYTNSVTFSRTHAVHIAAKVATDLKRMQRFYGEPTDKAIAEFETEVIELLRGGYIKRIIYGFKLSGKWIEPTLRYTSQQLAGIDTVSDDPGRVSPGADVRGAVFSSYLIRSDSWWDLSSTQQDEILRRLPFKRHSAAEPGVNGYFVDDRQYSAGGRALNRSSLRPYL